MAPHVAHWFHNARAVMNTSDNINRIRSIRDAAGILGVSYATLKRMLASGEGPKVTKLTTRRIGIQDQHIQQWMQARVTAA
jgi:predicted DNA-binding transcriptional regulator AlpA